MPAPVALADDSSEEVVATIYSHGSQPTEDSVSLGELAGCPRYTGPNIELYGPGGSQGPGDTLGAAWSLGTVLSCLAQPIPSTSIGGIVIVGPNGPQYGSGSELTASDLASPSDFSDPAESPVLDDDGSGLIYYRPWRGGQDENADDNFAVSFPSDFTFDVYEGSLLNVTLTAPTSVSAGTAAAFEATVSGMPAGATLSYAWDFDGGAPNSTAADPTVTFNAAGEYRVTLEVTDDDGGGGGASTTITVGGAGTAPQHGSGNPGPTRSSGHHPGGHRGKPTKSPSSTAAPHHRRHAHPSAPSTGNGSATSNGGASTTPASTAPAATPAASSPGPSSTSSGSTTTPAPPRRTAARPSGRGGHRPLPPSSGAGNEVSGRLLSSVVLVPAVDSPLVRLPGPQATAPPLRRALSGSPAPAIASGVGVLLLLALGAGRELRGRAAYDPRS